MANQNQDGKRKRMDAALRESEERFRLLVENAPGAIFVQTQHRFAYLNPAALRCFGAESPGQLLGQPVLDRYHARFHAQVKERIRLLNEEKKNVPMQEQILLKVDGSPFDIELSAAPIRWGGHDGALVFFRDITVRKRAEEELRASREQLRALATHLQTVREEERTRIAREIHDVLAQDLTRLKIDLVWLQRRLAKPGKTAAPEALAARVAEMSQMADAAINCVQRIATGLRPAVLDSLGLCAAVEWQARDFQAHAGIQCHVSVPEEGLPVDRDAATAAFRILQESLTNVLRHAHATRVNVSLGQEAGQLVLRVEDNGRGIRPEKLTNPMSIGLAGMRERALLLGGQLEIRSQPGSGTTVEMRLPLTGHEKLAEGQP